MMTLEPTAQLEVEIVGPSEETINIRMEYFKKSEIWFWWVLPCVGSLWMQQFYGVLFVGEIVFEISSYVAILSTQSVGMFTFLQWASYDILVAMKPIVFCCGNRAFGHTGLQDLARVSLQGQAISLTCTYRRIFLTGLLPVFYVMTVFFYLYSSAPSSFAETLEDISVFLGIATEFTSTWGCSLVVDAVTQMSIRAVAAYCEELEGAVQSELVHNPYYFLRQRREHIAMGDRIHMAWRSVSFLVLVFIVRMIFFATRLAVVGFAIARTNPLMASYRFLESAGRILCLLTVLLPAAALTDKCMNPSLDCHSVLSTAARVGSHHTMDDLCQEHNCFMQHVRSSSMGAKVYTVLIDYKLLTKAATLTAKALPMGLAFAKIMSWLKERET